MTSSPQALAREKKTNLNGEKERFEKNADKSGKILPEWKHVDNFF